jgi:hypothetical protein
MLKPWFFKNDNLLEEINISGNPIFSYCGFIPKRIEPVCVCCESLKGRVVWLVIQLFYDTISVLGFVYSGIKYSRSIIIGGLSGM